jgi:hypothetical protein
MKNNRRNFLSDCGMGLTGMVLGAMLAQNARAETPDGKPHFTPKAKRVIWLFMLGGVSHVESFDPKPALNKFAGKSIGDTPYKDALASPLVKDNAKSIMLDTRKLQLSLYPMQTGFKKYGQSGAEVADWFPHIGSTVDDLAIVRSAWTTDNDHGAILQFHTGRHILDGYLPTIGSWAHYGLGSINENLPSFVVLGEPPGDCCGGKGTHGSGYLGPEHTGVQLEVNPDHTLPFVSPGSDVFRKEQQNEFELMNKLNNIAAVEYPADSALRARIKSYELAYRMQMAVPEAIQFKGKAKKPSGYTAWTRRIRRASARSVWRLAGSPSAVSDSCRFITVARATHGMPIKR